MPPIPDVGSVRHAMFGYPLGLAKSASFCSGNPSGQHRKFDLKCLHYIKQRPKILDKSVRTTIWVPHYYRGSSGPGSGIDRRCFLQISMPENIHRPPYWWSCKIKWKKYRRPFGIGRTKLAAWNFPGNGFRWALKAIVVYYYVSNS